MKRLTYIIICLLGMAAAQAQEVKERIWVQTDKDFYLAGERMGLKLFTTDAQGKPQEYSRVTYVELLGDRENAVRLKVEVDGATGEGVMQLPHTLASGVYDLVAYTRWMRNEGEQAFFRRPVGVFNSLRYLSDTDGIVLAGGEAPAHAAGATHDGIPVRTDKPEYGNRETVKLNLEGIPEDALLSVSVVRRDVALENTAVSPLPAEAGGKPDRMYRPELEGLIIETRVKGEEDNTRIVRPNLTIQGDYIRYYAGQQAADGSVHFHTTSLQGVTEVVTATSGAGYLQPVSPFVATPPAQMRPLTLYGQYEKPLTERSLALQAAAYYYPKSPQEPVLPEDRLVRAAPKWVYHLDDYKRFPTFEETFVEFMPCVKTIGTKGSRRIVAFDAETQTSGNGNSLVLLDGVAVMDHELLLDYNPYLVKSVEVYAEDFVFGDQLYNGILFVKTPNCNLSGFTLPNTSVVHEYEGVQAAATYRKPSVGNKVQRHQPDFRHTLYWNGHVTGKDKQLEWRTSDMCGTYLVKVEGRTADGKTIRGYTSFEVK